MTNQANNKKQYKKNGMDSAKRNDIIFFCIIAFIPMAMLIFNWVFINFNSIKLAFTGYDDLGKEYFAGFDNIVAVLKDYAGGNSDMVKTLKNSVITYFVSVVVTAVVPIVFSYYMFKRLPGSSAFKVFVFLPNIISSIITITIYKFLLNRVFPSLFGLEQGILDNTDTAFASVLFYYCWMSFGSGMLVQIGAMNATDQSTIEAGKVDGVGFWGELWHIVLPKSYGVISIGFVTGFSSLFTNQIGLYAFRGENASSSISTLGYYYYVAVQRASAKNNFAQYAYWSAWGLIASAISIPVTFFYRWLVNHVGPSED